MRGAECMCVVCGVFKWAVCVWCVERLNGLYVCSVWSV